MRRELQFAGNAGEAGKMLKQQDDHLMAPLLRANEWFRQVMSNEGNRKAWIGQGSTESGTGKGGFNLLVFYDRLLKFDSWDAVFLTSMLPGKKENET